MDFAPGPVWEQVQQPVLLLKGARDANSTPEVARREIEAALQRGGNHHVKFVVFPDGDHSMVRWPAGKRIPPPLFARGYLETMVQWAAAQSCVRK